MAASEPPERFIKRACFSPGSGTFGSVGLGVTWESALVSVCPVGSDAVWFGNHSFKT